MSNSSENGLLPLETSTIRITVRHSSLSSDEYITSRWFFFCSLLHRVKVFRNKSIQLFFIIRPVTSAVADDLVSEFECEEQKPSENGNHKNICQHFRSTLFMLRYWRFEAIAFLKKTRCKPLRYVFALENCQFGIFHIVESNFSQTFENAHK